VNVIVDSTNFVEYAFLRADNPTQVWIESLGEFWSEPRLPLFRAKDDV
jgi:hypothetical protein